MKIQTIFRLLVLAVIVMTVIPAYAARTDIAPTDEAILKLQSQIKYERTHAAESLSQMDAVKVLEKFKQVFPKLWHEGRQFFEQHVLPNLSEKESNAFLLEELHNSIAILNKCYEIETRAETEGETYELYALYESLDAQMRWSQWVLRAKPDMRYVETYDEIQDILLKQKNCDSPFHFFARSLYHRNKKRAVGDFNGLLLNNDPMMCQRGIGAFQGADLAPTLKIAQKYFELAGDNPASNADQIVYLMNRDHLNLLISLLESPSDKVAKAAEYKLSNIAHLTDRERNEPMDKTMTAAQRAKAWQSWWADHQGDTDDKLRRRYVKKMIADSGDRLDKNILSKLRRHGDFEEVYPVFSDALSSADSNIRKLAAMHLGYMSVRGHQEASDLLIRHCQNLSEEQFSEFGGGLARIKDRRVEELFKKHLAVKTKMNTPWKQRVARQLGQSDQEWAMPLLLQLIIEDGEGNASVMLHKFEDAEKAVPRLLEALLKETDRHKRYAICSAIKSVGSKDLAKELARVLPETPESNELKGGIRADVLKLMEVFPHPDAKPFLIELLKSEYISYRSKAASILGKLGDQRGAKVLLDNMQIEKISRSPSLGYQIASALYSIGWPNTKKVLEEKFMCANEKGKEIILRIMAEQKDPAYIPFLDKQASAEDERIAFAARQQISGLIYFLTKEQSRTIKMLDEDMLPLIHEMFLWAFFDEKPGRGDMSFPDHRSVSQLKGAVVSVYTGIRNPFQQPIEFIREDKTTEFQTNQPITEHIAGDGTPAGRSHPYAGGGVTIRSLNNYMSVSLSLNYGSGTCLFKRVGNKWQAIGQAGGTIE